MIYIVTLRKVSQVVPKLEQANSIALNLAKENPYEIVRIERYPIPYKRPKFYLIKEEET